MIKTIPYVKNSAVLPQGSSLTRAVESLREIASALKDRGIEEAHKEAEIILTDCLGIERVEFYRDNPPLSASEAEKIRKVLERRREREPLHYIIGSVDFFGLTIKVGPGVLIPRPETELIVEEAIKAVASCELRVASENDSRFTPHDSRILDLCTGSGCIALAIAKHLPEADVYGTDISEKALEYSRENARLNNIGNVTFVKGDLFEPVKGMKFDIIVSNPPYIKKAEIGTLQPEVSEWEPPEALDGGDDGLHFYRRILSEAPGYLTDDGLILLEAGQGEAGNVVSIAEDSGLRGLSVTRDYAGIERVIALARR